jgi:hypothetical protein
MVIAPLTALLSATSRRSRRLCAGAPLEGSKVTPLPASARRSPRDDRSFPSRGLDPAAFHGAPLIVCCADHWEPVTERAQQRLRSELRGLGVALVLLLPDRILCLKPDEECSGSESEVTCDRAAFEALWKLGPGPCIWPSLGFLILNASGDVVWSHLPEPEPELQHSEALIEALSGAARRLQQSAGRSFAVTPPELLTSLMGAFAMTFGDPSRPSAPPSTHRAPAP